MNKKITAIILDWAGTTVDFGSFAPVAAFMKAFETFGIFPTLEETRAPMGMQKRAHIERMLNGKRLSVCWLEKYGRGHTDADIDELYAEFEPALFDVLFAYAAPLDGVLEAVASIREMGIKIGSTTGYTSAMMKVVAPLAKQAGYAPDCIVCPDEVGGIGRPYPYMLWRNLEKLGVEAIAQTVKIGDTAADMEEGKNAGCICVGVIKGSNMLGLGKEECDSMQENERVSLYRAAKEKYIAAGADHVIDDITMLPALLHALNQ